MALKLNIRNGEIHFQGKDAENLLLMDADIFKVKKMRQSGYKRVYALLCEPTWIHGKQLKKFLIKYNRYFDKIFTFDKDLLKLDPKKFTFIHPLVPKFVHDYGIHEKTKNLSMVISHKRGTFEYELRHQIGAEFKDLIDCLKPGDKRVQWLDDYFKDVRYAIVVENTKMDNYFTEKVTECFYTGTVPIYRGCPNIGKFFNTDGIITFDTIEDLRAILSTLSEEDYLSRMDAIRENFELVKNHPTVCLGDEGHNSEFYAKILDEIPKDND
ncbi:MAG: hypothetical protein ACOYK9_03620 [Chlamydiia bacterium]